MKTEQERADALAEQLDALFAGETAADDLPADLSELLEVGQEISAAAPQPRPEATTALKASLEESLFGNGTPPANGVAPFGPVAPVVIIAALVGLALLGLLGGWFLVDDPPTPEAAQPDSTVQAIEPALSPAAPVATIEPTPPNQAGDSLVIPPVSSVTATIILDILPPLVPTAGATLDATTIEITLPGGLVPGQSQPSGDDDDDRGGSGGDSGSSGGGGDDDDDDD